MNQQPAQGQGQVNPGQEDYLDKGTSGDTSFAPWIRWLWSIASSRASGFPLGFCCIYKYMLTSFVNRPRRGREEVRPRQNRPSETAWYEREDHGWSTGNVGESYCMWLPLHRLFHRWSNNNGNEICGRLLGRNLMRKEWRSFEIDRLLMVTWMHRGRKRLRSSRTRLMRFEGVRRMVSTGASGWTE